MKKKTNILASDVLRKKNKVVEIKLEEINKDDEHYYSISTGKGNKNGVIRWQVRDTPCDAQYAYDLYEEYLTELQDDGWDGNPQLYSCMLEHLRNAENVRIIKKRDGYWSTGIEDTKPKLKPKTKPKPKPKPIKVERNIILGEL